MTASPIASKAGVTLATLAAHAGAEVDGDGEIVVDRVATLESAQPGSISFLANLRYRRLLTATRASAIILAPSHAHLTRLPKLIASEPYVAYARVAALLSPDPAPGPGTHATAVVDSTAQVDASASIAAHAIIGARTFVGAGAVIGEAVVVGRDCSVGDGTRLYPRVVVYPKTVLGSRCVVHSGAVLGADGFGMAEESGRWIKVPQLGGLSIGADVEIGANTTIDRGAIDDTVIEDDVKLDNLIQIGHNVRIGRHTAIAGCACIAGSVVIGRNCKIAGGARISGHITIGDGVVVSGSTTIFDSIREPGIYTGLFPPMPHSEWRHAASLVRRLRELAQRLRAVERSMEDKGG